MPETFSQVFFPKSMQDLFSSWARYPESTIFSSGAYFLQRQRARTFSLPQAILALDDIEDLRRVDRTERYIEIGTMVSLNQILKLGKVVPEALREAISTITNPPLRNLISLGSAICQKTDAQIITAALVALDARYELRTANQSRWISALSLHRRNSMANAEKDGEKERVFEKQELLCRVRIPLDQWDYCLCRLLKSSPEYPDSGGFAIFMASLQKDILSSVRVAFSGKSIISEKDIESTLVGKKLPFNMGAANAFVGLWKNHFASLKEEEEDIKTDTAFVYDRLINFIESAIMRFVD